MLTTDALREAERLMTICNACRYCEGLCAVFPAMEMRRTFGAGDLNYLANLCHQCGACYPDCQYAPPHQFDVNVPATFARLRNESYAAYAWPRALAATFARNGLYVALAAAAGVAVFILGLVTLADPAALFADNAGNFYRLMPHAAMVAIFGLVSLYCVIAFVMSVAAFWRDINAGGPRIGPMAVLRALHDVFALRYLGGGGGGCTSETEAPSSARRRYHHFTFYGFLLCFAATCVATLYHYWWRWPAPYPLWSLPVILGTLGGLGLIIGPAGLFVLARRREAKLTDPSHRGMTTAFIAMLFLTSLTGLLLLSLRGTGAMGILLAVHLGLVLALFLSLPYGKFVHGLYRFLALVKYAAERRRGSFVE
jgi:citrate/tricarballylate utilization protein